MHKLSVYLNNNQLKKLKILLDEEDLGVIEEFLNETIYNVIAEKWIEHKSASMQRLLEFENFQEEIVHVNIDGNEFEVWSDGNQAIITVAGVTSTIQKINGNLHFALDSNVYVPCSDAASTAFTKALDEAGVELKNHSESDIEGRIIEKDGK